MSGLGELGGLPGFVESGMQVSQGDIDQYVNYMVLNPVVSNVFVGTAIVGTSTQTKALVLINKALDYPRNLLYSVAGTNDIGGTWTVNGVDQFGKAVTEVKGFGTLASAGSAYGTQIFDSVTSGSFTFAVGSAGNGSAQLGVGTVGTSVWFGLPCKIGGTSDVKGVTWINNGAGTSINGGTVGAYVDATRHAFRGTNGIAITDVFVVQIKSTYDNTTKGTMCAL